MTKANRSIVASFVADANGEKFRIARNGEVHIFGVMPNTNRTGWYFAGFADNIVTEQAWLIKSRQPETEA